MGDSIVQSAFKCSVILMKLSGNGRDGNSNGFDVGSAHPCTGWGALRGGIQIYLSCGSSAYDRRLKCRSRMRRESHVRFCEGGRVRLPSATRLNIYVSSIKAGERVMASATRFLEQRLKLRVNRAKSAVAHVSHRKFLGYRILGSDGLGIHPRSVERFKDKVRALTKRNGPSSPIKVIIL